MRRGCAMGLGWAVEFLNTAALGGGSSRMTDLMASFGLLCGTASSFSSTSTENRISKWAFEVAFTVAKGVKLFHSLSKENIQFLKNEIFHSRAVHHFFSEDMDQLLLITAADMREKLDVFFGGVIRFGNLCKDPHWHNLDNYFSNLRLDSLNHEQIRVEAETTVQELNPLVEQTLKLYEQLIALNSIEGYYLRQRGMGVSTWTIDQLAEKEGLVRFYKKRSLWSRKFEEIVEKLVNVATYTHITILEAFESNGRTLINEAFCKIPQRLGKFDRHYAYIANKIGNVLSNYTKIELEEIIQALPSDVNTSLRSRLQTLNVKEELLVSQIETEMEKTLHWLVTLAENTERKDPYGLQTLYHADKQKVDECIIELIIWLHRLGSKAK